MVKRENSWGVALADGRFRKSLQEASATRTDPQSAAPYVAQLKAKDGAILFAEYDRDEHPSIEEVCLFCDRPFVFKGSRNEYGKPSKKGANDGPLLRVVLHYEEVESWTVKKFRTSRRGS